MFKKSFKKICSFAVCSTLLVSANVIPVPNHAIHYAVAASTNQIAFPGAEGGGKFATGGRGGNVVYVTNLNDSGAGSFRDAVSTSNRIVVFKVGGTIELKSDVVVASNVTVAGQTAPGGAGITLKNYKIGLGGENIILRFISSRPGERGTSADYDAFGGANGTGSIVDHCSIGWANDEQWGLYSQNDNMTVQYSVIGPSNSFSYHSKGIHGFGIMLGRSNVSWHHNLIPHNVSRNFRGKVPGTGVADFTNNVIYNWSSQTAYGTLGHLNYVNNTLKMGNSTVGGHNYISVGDSGTSPENYLIYLTGNRFLNKDDSNYSTFTSNNWTGISYANGKTEANTRSNSAFAMTVNDVNVSTALTAESAVDSYNHVLVYAGAGISSTKRTAIDQQVAYETKTGTGTLTGARPYAEATAEQKATIDKYKMQCGVTYVYPAAVLTGAPTDTDGDGMSDTWESARGLNPKSKTASNGSLESSGDYCGKGYTNIEYYINDLTVNAFPLNTVILSPTITPTATPTQTPTVTPTPTPTPNVTTVPISEGQFIKSFVVNDIENAADWSIQSNLQVGDTLYGDRTTKFAGVPTSLLGAEWIRTACDSKSSTSQLASFYAKSNVSVYVGLDSRVITIPTWLSNWTKTSELVIGDNDVSFNLYKKDFSSGSTVVLGDNGQSSGAVNYTVIVTPNTIATPTVVPTMTPTVEPTVVPTIKPTTAPTLEPTIAPTVKPTTVPTTSPSLGAKPVVTVTTTNNGNSIGQTYQVTAKGGTIDLSKITIVYTADGMSTAAQSVFIDNAALQLNVAPYYSSINSTVTGTINNGKLTINSNSSAQLSEGTGYLTIDLRFAKTDWSTYGTLSNQVINVYYDGVLIQ